MTSLRFRDHRSRSTAMIARFARRAVTLPLVMLATACDSNPYDPAQQPRVTISQVAPDAATIEWEPAGAQLVRVYRGSTAGDGYDDRLVWSVAAISGNGLASGVRYGVTPSGGTVDVAAKALEPGAVYTAQVTRQDPRGSGEGFTNTRNRYVGTATFTIPMAP